MFIIYRKIFNDLSSPQITVTKIEEESESDKDEELSVATGHISNTQSKKELCH